VQALLSGAQQRETLACKTVSHCSRFRARGDNCGTVVLELQRSVPKLFEATRWRTMTAGRFGRCRWAMLVLNPTCGNRVSIDVLPYRRVPTSERRGMRRSTLVRRTRQGAEGARERYTTTPIVVS